MRAAMDKCRQLLISHWEAVSYLFFGVLTTVINYGTFWIFHALLGDAYDLFSNLIAFVAAVTFAYITNKLYVFESRSWSFDVLRREIPSFLGARLVSFGFEEAGLFSPRMFCTWGNTFTRRVWANGFSSQLTAYCLPNLP